MNIKTKLSIQFTIIVTGVLFFSSILVLYFSYTSQINKFRDTLVETARSTASLMMNVTEINSDLLKKIHQSTIQLQEEEIVMTDANLNKIYSNNARYLSDITLKANSKERYLSFFTLGGKDGVCYKQTFNGSEYMVFVMAYDKSRVEYLSELRRILLWSFLLGILLSVLSSYLFSQRATKPILKIIKNVKEINSMKLGNRLDEGNRKDEIAQLAITFNEMLTNLEIAFRNQQDFVSNASHELRTPVSVMVSESEYLLSHDRTKAEYVKHISGVISDLKKLNALLNSLLDLAQINKNKAVVFENVRIDEIVFNAIFEVKNRYIGRKIVPRIVYPEDGSDLLVYGNTGLLEIVFENLLDNACKFSNDEVFVDFEIDDEQIGIMVTDSGIGIPSAEIEKIYNPFTRASNVKYIGGFGIGLSLVNGILKLHKANLTVQSHENEGTTIDIVFSRRKG
jgi:two-component system, OmpR family, sensor histidine kinase ArlS